MTDDGPAHIIEHLRKANAQAAIVVDGNADVTIATLLAAGWTLSEEPAILCSGKRIRYLQMPKTEKAS